MTDSKPESDQGNFAAGETSDVRGGTGRTASGWMLVPIEPTHEMMVAVDDAYGDGGDFPDMWEAALAAAPSAPADKPTLRESADALMAAGHTFWRACLKEGGGGAVRWLLADDGTTIIFTRGEYRDQLMHGIASTFQAPVTVFESPASSDDDDLSGVVASTAEAADKAEAVAWMTPDRKRVVTAETMAANDIGAGASAMRVYTIPLYAAPPTELLREVMEALTAISVMYAHAWDRADDGALVMLPLSIQKFEAAHEKVRAALAKLREQLGEQG